MLHKSKQYTGINPMFRHPSQETHPHSNKQYYKHTQDIGILKKIQCNTQGVQYWPTLLSFRKHFNQFKGRNLPYWPPWTSKYTQIYITLRLLHNTSPENWTLVKNCFPASQLAMLHFSKWNNLWWTKLGVRQHPTVRTNILITFHCSSKDAFINEEGRGIHSDTLNLSLPFSHSLLFLCSPTPRCQQLTCRNHLPFPFSLLWIFLKFSAHCWIPNLTARLWH